MSTNITEQYRHAFEDLTSGRYDNFALFGTPSIGVLLVGDRRSHSTLLRAVGRGPLPRALDDAAGQHVHLFLQPGILSGTIPFGRFASPMIPQRLHLLFLHVQKIK